MTTQKLAQCYVDGWKKGNREQILETLTEDCLIIESHGPVYRGKPVVNQWITEWHQAGNRVEKWVITSFHGWNGGIVFEWVFAYKGKNIREAFEGITIAKIRDEKIAELREYRATSFPFMWHPLTRTSN